MLTSSSTLNAAAAAYEQTITTQVFLDPSRTGNPEAVDLTVLFESWEIDRTLTTDVPSASRMIVGYVSGEFTGTALGSQTVIAGQRWSPYASGSVFFGKDPLNTAMRVKAGMVTSAGSELQPRFTGYLRSISTQVDTVALDALDRNSQLLNDTTIPMLANSFKDTTVTPNRGTRPGLSANTIMDFALRQNGLYASPPPRAGCLLSVPGHGSLSPEPGYGVVYTGVPNVTVTGIFEEPTTTTETHDGSMVAFDHVGAFSGGPFGDNGKSGVTPSVVPVCALSSPSDIVGTYQPNTAVYSDVFANGKSVTVEAWVYCPSTPPQGLSASDPIFGIRFVQSRISGSADSYHLAAVGLQANGSPYVSVGSTFVRAQGTASTTKGWTYFLARLTFGASSTSVSWRVNNQTVQTATVAAVPAPGANGTGGQFYINLCTNRVSTATTWQTGERTPFEALQVTTESGPASNYGFVPTAYLDYSLNPLTVSPFSTTGRDTQTLLQDLTAAEFGLAYFDELGNFYFYNRARWGRSPGNTSQLTVTSSNQLETLAVTQNTDGIINDVEITYTLYGIGNYQQVFLLSRQVGVHSGTTYTWRETLDNPTVAMDVGVPTVAPYDGQLPQLTAGAVTHSGYRASFDPAGAGTNDPPVHLSVWVRQIDEQTVLFTVQNRETRPIYMVSGSDQASGSEGQKFIYLFGRPVTVQQADTSDSAGDGTTVAKASDATSITKYGDRNYTSAQNDWLQSVNAATNVATSLLAQLKDPHPLIENVSIKAHPGLQLGDRITLKDTAGTQLDTTSSTIGTVIVGLNESFSSDGYAQSLTLRLMDMSQPIT